MKALAKDMARDALSQASRLLREGFPNAALSYTQDALMYARMTDDRLLRAHVAQAHELTSICADGANVRG